MTGKEMIEWIKENHAEDRVLIVEDENCDYKNVKGLWVGESLGGAIMIDAERAAPMQKLQ